MKIQIENPGRLRNASVFFLLCTFLIGFSNFTFGQQATRKQEGLNVNAPKVFVLTNAMVHLDSSATIENGKILVVGEKVKSVGADIAVPKGAQIIDLKGRHVYPGFVDPHVDYSVEWSSVTGTAYWNDNVRPQLKISDMFELDDIDHEDLRKTGITAGLFVPDSGIIRGQSSVILTRPADHELAIVKRDFAQHLLLTVQRGPGRSRTYPNSPMGGYALARQSMYDAKWYAEANQFAAADPKIPRPEVNAALAALQPAIQAQQPIMVTTSNEIFALRADRFAREFGLKLIVVGSGEEYRHLDEIVAMGRDLILPINFPKPPNVSSPEESADVSLETMMHWDIAPENPARLASKGVHFSFTTRGLKDVGDYLARVRTAVQRGLAESDALDALTINPARLLKLDKQMGSIDAGKLANLVVTDNPLFEDKSKIVESWVAGERFEFDPAPLREVEGTWQLKAKAKGMSKLSLKVSGGKGKKGSVSAKFLMGDGGEKPEKKKDDKNADDDAQELDEEAQDQDDAREQDEKTDEEPDEKTKDKNDSIKVSAVNLNGTRLSGAFDSSEFGYQGISRFSFAIGTDETGIGQLVLPDGKSVSLTAKLMPKEETDESQDESEDAKADADNDGDDNDGNDNGETDKVGSTSEEDEKAKDDDAEKEEAEKDDDAEKEEADKSASFDVNYPLGALGRSSAPEQPDSVLITNVTVWTCSEAGIIKNGAVLFGDGIILSVYEDGEELPDADLVIDGTGKHITPGIIDCHSHSASDSGINESGQAVTAEVRIGDFIDADSMNIYRQLAGGVTTINILHGSANPIGGQNQVIKLRWGALDEAMKFTEAPQGIKFALGENVKQSNWARPTGRYPQTRMGVVELIENSFRAAKEYRARQRSWGKQRNGLPPRIDLELEALAEIVEGTRWIHCHSYRQDEILALIRTLDKHHIQIGTFQHILEGYKVAQEMAEHGAMASAFADWWAYKYEVKDATPYAGALMHRAGVNVSFNSDDSELARHLNQEAAKAVKYGGVSQEEALKFVTLNPAMQLRIDSHVGSIEIGKHADLVIWSGHPLSNLSRCEQTWVDGRKYFDLKDDSQARKKNQEMRTALIQKILASGEKMETKDKQKSDPAKLWPRFDVHCGMSGHHYEDRQFNGLHQGHGHR